MAGWMLFKLPGSLSLSLLITWQSYFLVRNGSEKYFYYATLSFIARTKKRGDFFLVKVNLLSVGLMHVASRGLKRLTEGLTNTLPLALRDPGLQIVSVWGGHSGETLQCACIIL